MFIMQRLLFSLMKPIVRGFLTAIYRPRVIDAEKMPKKGGLLLVANHASFLDPVLIYCYQKCFRRNIRFVADQAYVPKWFGTWAAKMTNSILFEHGNPRSVVKMIRTVQEGLRNGDAICIFPEGTISRTGQIRMFEPGVLAFLKKGNEDIPVQPVFLGGLWGTKFSYAKHLYNKKTPRKLFRRLTIAFGDVIRHPRDAYQLYRAVVELGVDSMDPKRFPRDRQYMIPPRQMIRNLRGKNTEIKMVDSTGMRLSARQVLLRILVARRVFHKLWPADEKNVGLLLPTSIGAVIANAAFSLDLRTPINLNYTMSNETLDYCCELTGVKRVLTSKKFLDKFPNMKLKAEWVLAEDALKQVPFSAKLLGLFDSLLPTCILERKLGITRYRPNDLMTIIFTSGSTGRPKGTMLSFDNIAANVHQFYELFNPDPNDRLMAPLPFFHSFGYTTSVWCPLTCPFGAVYHFSPLDAKIIGKMTREEKATVLVSTPTFFRNYIKRCPKEDFADLNTPVAGAEKLPAELAHAWREKYGQTMVEGFGATELSPVLSASIPKCRHQDTYHVYEKLGTVGPPLAGIAVRITDPETGEELPQGAAGMMEVKGPTVMLGYYKAPEQTASVIHDGWYTTGDVAKIDEDGFIVITGRLSRISKIGGEMVPHVYIEEEIDKVLQALDPLSDDDDATLRVAVTAVPDPRKGERLVVFLSGTKVTAEEICAKMTEANIPQIWIPAASDFHTIKAIPVLGSGKPSLKEIRDQALSLYSAIA